MYAIETKQLTKRYKDLTAVDHLDLTVKQGELLALLGVNGAGKSTAIKLLSCLSRPTSGDALILGSSVLSEPLKVKKVINVSPQETAVAPNLTVGENLRLMSGIYGNSQQQAKLQADRIITQFGMEEIATSKAKTLSGGWQRRLSIAMALISRPEILFLDEPTLGLDVIARRQLWRAIETLKGSITIILTTHYMEEAEALSDRIAVMAKGRLKAVGTAQELIQRCGAKDFESAFIAIAEGGEEMQSSKPSEKQEVFR